MESQERCLFNQTPPTQGHQACLVPQLSSKCSIISLLLLLDVFLYFLLDFYFQSINVLTSIYMNFLFLVAQMVMNLPAMQERGVWSLGWEDPLEEGMATHSNILAWRIPWTEESGRLQSNRLQRVRHYWASHTTLCNDSSSYCVSSLSSN